MQEILAKIIETFFTTQWALLTTPPAIRYRNVPFKQPANGEWVSFWIHSTNVGQISLGTEKVERQIGTVAYIIVTPKNIGDRRAKVIADMIGDIFRFQQVALMSDGSITQLQNGIVIQVVAAGALKTEADDILETEGGDDIETENAAATPVLTLLFRSPEPIDVNSKTDYYQLNLSVPYQADKIYT